MSLQAIGSGYPITPQVLPMLLQAPGHAPVVSVGQRPTEGPMHTIAIVNQKGGCGKTTTAINLAGVFAAKGFRTLLVDMDPQGHCAAGLAIPEQRIDKTIGDAMLAAEDSPIDADRMLWRVSRNLDLAPSTTRLAALEAARGELASRPEPEKRLKQALARFQTKYDVCLIDCSPAIGLLAFNAMVAANELIIPVETGFFALQGANKQVNSIKALAKRLGISPTYRLLPTMHDTRSMLSKDLLDEINRRFPGKTIPVVIRHDTSLREAASFGQPVIEYAPMSHGCVDYLALATWLSENSLGKQGNGELESEQGEETKSPAGETPESSYAAASTVPTVSRAADMAARAKRLQQHAQVPSSAEQIRIQEQPVQDSRLTIAQAPTAEPEPNQAITIEPKPISLGAISPSTASATLPPPEPFAVTAVSPPAAVLPRTAGTERSFGVRAEPMKARFALPGVIGKRVSIAGEFNNWSAEATPMRLSAGGEAFEAEVSMPPGANQYRLVVDGAWIADPYNPNIAPNPFGGTNSVVWIPPSALGPQNIGAEQISVRQPKANLERSSA